MISEPKKPARSPTQRVRAGEEERRSGRTSGTRKLTQLSGVRDDEMDRNLQLLGLARKAGMIAIGGDAVSSAARERKAKLVISAADSSEGSLRRARINAKESNIIYITVPYTKFELGSITGRGSPGTVAILDAGLAASFMKGLAESNPDDYGNAAEQLAQMAETMNKRRKHTSRRTAR